MLFIVRARLFFVMFIASVMSVSAQAATLPNFTELVEKVGPAVVNISTTQKIKGHGALPPGMDVPEFFKKFFGERGHGDDGGEPSDELTTQSLGSGFIIDSSGYIITNNHVIRNAESIIVRLNDRREFKAEVIGSDPRSDVALLKLDATNLPSVVFAKGDNLKVGEWVMAIGSPFGFDHSVSVGVVSAIGRNLPSESYVPFIQTDVAINPGNSGGPLFNLDGEVVGINSQIFSRTGGFMGLSFAIPIKVADEVVSQLKEKGRVTRGWLGILIQDVNRELAESFGMKQPKGAVVLRILENSPASKSGFEVGDVVVEFDGVTIYKSSDLPIAVGSTKTGSKVKVKVIREGQKKTLNVVIEELPTEKELAQSRPNKNINKTNRIGAMIEDLTSDQRRATRIKKGGVFVGKVAKGPARTSGIKAGDVIIKINGEDIKNARQFRSLVKKLPDDKPLPVLIQRGSSPIFLVIKIKKG